MRKRVKEDRNARRGPPTTRTLFLRLGNIREEKKPAGAEFAMQTGHSRAERGEVKTGNNRTSGCELIKTLNSLIKE